MVTWMAIVTELSILQGLLEFCSWGVGTANPRHKGSIPMNLKRLCKSYKLQHGSHTGTSCVFQMLGQVLRAVCPWMLFRKLESFSTMDSARALRMGASPVPWGGSFS